MISDTVEEDGRDEKETTCDEQEHFSGEDLDTTVPVGIAANDEEEEDGDSDAESVDADAVDQSVEKATITTSIEQSHPNFATDLGLVRVSCILLHLFRGWGYHHRFAGTSVL
jgi:hypothetical protein